MSIIATSQSGSDDAGENQHCPICGSSQFAVFRGRENARCSKCHAVERTRLLWMILEKMGLFRRGLRIMHIAPEGALAKRFFELSGDRYYACDIDPARYARLAAVVRPIDLCSDLVKLPSRGFDLIIHTHVLEHVRGEPESILHELERLLAPGGHHFFAVPMRGEETSEDLSDDLPLAERAAIFGQADHYRLFGTRSIQEILDRVWGKRERHNIEPLELFSADELTTAAIPQRGWAGISGLSIFHHTRPRTARINSNRQISSEPTREKSVDLNVGPITENVLAGFQPDAGNLILHIGMPSAGSTSLQHWFAKNRVAALGAGVDYWSIAQNHSEAMMSAFADSRPVGHSLDQFLDGLTGHTGFISAAQLWNLPSAQVKILAAYLRDRGIRPLVLCWLRQPMEYMTEAMLQQSRSSLTMGDLDLEFERKIPARYSRLKAWVEQFGPDRVIAEPFGGDAVEQTRDLLQRLGIRFDSVDAVDRPPAPPMSLTAAKALLALNQVQKSADATTQWSPRLRGILRDIKGEDFQLPESLLLNMTGLFEKDVKYLVEQFSIDHEWLVSGGIGLDDPLFFQWYWEEIVRLLTAFNEALLQADTRKPASTSAGVA